MSSNAASEVWLRTDEIDEFIGALENVAHLARTVGQSVSNWKWLILALHNALQGACTCALRGTDTAGITMLTKDSAKAVWHWLDVKSRQDPCPPMPEEKLAPMVELYRRVQEARYLSEPYRLVAHKKMNKDVQKLNELRNGFAHFVPKGYSLEVSGMPRIVEHCCEAIEHLAVTHPTFWHHLDDTRTERIRIALLSIRQAMANYRTQYNRN